MFGAKQSLLKTGERRKLPQTHRNEKEKKNREKKKIETVTHNRM